jgi:hypothetical protein
LAVRVIIGRLITLASFLTSVSGLCMTYGPTVSFACIPGQPPSLDQPRDLLVHRFYGLNADIIQKADLLAEQGYTVRG